MKLKYNIENMGNIDKASISIKPLTIIAGENSSGKTFVTKSLYTILDSLYKNYFLNSLVSKLKLLERGFNYFQIELSKPTKKDIEFKEYSKLYLEEIKFFIIEVRESKFEEQEVITDRYIKKLNKFYNRIEIYLKDRLKTKKFFKYENLLSEMLENLNELNYVINKRVDVIIDGISTSLDIGFKKNFQITNLENLINKKQSKSLKLSLTNLGNIEIDNNQDIHFDLKTEGINDVQNVENIIFFDSPVYIKIRKALENSKDNYFSLFNDEEDKYLKGYPQYLDQLYDYIDKKYIDIPELNLISQEIQEIIKGKLEISNNGDIDYKDNQNNIIPLSLTAMGISNIGLIDLLIRNNIINRGSFLIMDEPEVHLHPKWQVIMAQLLYKIAKSGANIIIATHSLDFLKAFENILKEDGEKAENIIAINKMPYNEEFLELSELEKVGIVLDDLSKPFYDLYMQDT